MLTYLLMLAAAPAPAELGPAWGTFSRDPQLRRAKEIVEIGTLGVDPATRQLDYWMRHSHITSKGTEVSWADSRTCPAMRPAVEGMQEIRVPAIVPPGTKTEVSIMADGTIYRLAVPSADGRIEFDGNIGTSVGAWIDASLLSLRSCWSDRVPKRTPRSRY